MKKIINYFAMAIMLVAMICLAGCGSKETLKIYLPGEYISDDIVPAFEKEYNCKVEVELFESNEMMYTKLSAGDSYDLLIPSDYMIERLIKENMIQKLDRSKLTNVGDITAALNASPYNDFNPDNAYAVPYFWGTVGIVYDTTIVAEEDLNNLGFDIMKNTKYAGQIYMYDSERDSFMIALKALGYSMNTENEDEINEAYEWLVELNQTMEPIYVIDEVIDNMAQGRKALAIVYSGDAAYILDENENMSYFTPDCGTNVWVDAMVIPTNAENPDLAHKFIDFVTGYDIAMNNTEAVGYASVNDKVLNEVSAEGGLYDGNVAYLPRTGFANDEVFHDNEVIRKKLSELWIKVKASK